MNRNTVYKRTCRQCTDSTYADSGKSRYIQDSGYCGTNPSLYIRPFLLIQKDLQTLFEFIEPHDDNINCFSLRTHELLVRACIEVEQNFKGILSENFYTLKPSENWNTSDYIKINETHFLSRYIVEVPLWHGGTKSIKPFDGWDKTKPTKSLLWYNAYNNSKHDRYTNFKLANLENTLCAICGLLVILSAQFYTYSFQPGPVLLACEGGTDGIGDYFNIKFPEIPEEDRYNIDNQVYSQAWDINFEKINYNNL